MLKRSVGNVLLLRIVFNKQLQCKFRWTSPPTPAVASISSAPCRVTERRGTALSGAPVRASRRQQIEKQ
jgi:hypothetical protein